MCETTVSLFSYTVRTSSLSLLKIEGWTNRTVNSDGQWELLFGRSMEGFDSDDQWGGMTVRIEIPIDGRN